jgi:hypothetical protein
MTSASASAASPKSSQPTAKTQIAATNVTEVWVHKQYLLHGFHAHGPFKGYSNLTHHLRKVAPADNRERAVQILNQ